MGCTPKSLASSLATIVLCKTGLVHRDQLVDVVDLGPIDSPDLTSRLAWFTGEVVGIKTLVLQRVPAPVGGTPNSSVGGTQRRSFNPEFSGTRGLRWARSGSTYSRTNGVGGRL